MRIGTVAMGAVLLVAACSENPAEVVQAVGAVRSFEVEEPKGEDPPPTNPINECPAPFTLESGKGSPDDANLDSWICRMVTPAGHKVIIDNHIPPDQIGECPEPFVLSKLTKETEAKDRNGNFLVCTLEGGGGAVIDDSHRPRN